MRGPCFMPIDKYAYNTDSIHKMEDDLGNLVRRLAAIVLLET